jgi:hypothetical protein
MMLSAEVGILKKIVEALDEDVLLKLMFPFEVDPV